ncbi:MAG: MogA/MoaB family molybdenum cofactor biosynthesis protein [Phycisphaerae bacterium]
MVLTISDRCAAGTADDKSGPAIIEHLHALDGVLVHRETVPDDVDRIRGVVTAWLGRCELIITTGGTGVAERDVTPEAIEPLIKRPLPGFGEIMRMNAFERTAMSILSRGGAGIAGRTLVVWLPGATKGVRECLDWLTPAMRHACQFLRGEKPH